MSDTNQNRPSHRLFTVNGDGDNARWTDSYGLSATVADARFIKPLDHIMIERLAREHEVLITVEEGSAGGFGAAVMHHLAWRGFLDGNLKFRPMTLPDLFIEHDTPARQMERAGLTAMDIVATALSCFQRPPRRRRSAPDGRSPTPILLPKGGSMTSVQERVGYQDFTREGVSYHA